MKRFQASIFILCALLAASCTPTRSEPNMNNSSASSEASEQSTESGAMTISATRNVSYIGTVSELGSSISMEGTHKLILADGQFILLESTDANLSLNAYMGKRVEVRGSVQPTVEGGSGIMRVEEVTILGETLTDDTSSSSLSTTSGSMCGGIAGIQCPSGMSCTDDPSDSCDPSSGGADCSGICIEETVDPKPEVAASSSSPKPPAPVISEKIPEVKSESSMSSALSGSENNSFEPSIVLMAKQKNDENLWTQKYCTSHRAFCISAHKNWYFKSFGATTTILWHVEFGLSPIEELHTGPIVLNLVSGSSASMNAKDGEVRSEGSDIVGFKDWTGDSHFELIADARLREAVQIMLRSITPYTPTE